MRDLTCLSTIITDDLAAHIDISNLKSWDLNPDFTAISLTKWSGGFSSNIFLYDFGLTGSDNGRVSGLTESLNLTQNDNKLKLFRVGYLNETGSTSHFGYEIYPVTGTSVGNYFIANGGYLQGFFRLKDYNFQILPSRYGKGVTIETIVNILPESFNDGYFLLLGARAEDKYIPPFSGECVQYTASTTATTFGSRGLYTVVNTEVLPSGVTTSEDNFLDSKSIVTVTKKAIQDQYHTEEIEIENLNNDIDSNVIGFFLSSDRKIGYTRIDSKGIIQSEDSPYMIKTGWTIITLTFNPYEDITDKTLLDCTPVRTGDFYVHINGRQVWKIEDFTEFYFRGFKNSKEKQLGVPYNVSWGGGSFGLKHSYHWELNPKTIFDENSQVEVASGFTFVLNPTVTYECPPEPISGFTQYVSVSADTTTFQNIDPCDPSHVTPNTVLAINHDGATGDTTTNEYYLEYLTDLELISNRDYTFTVNFYNRDIFKLWSTSEAGMFFVANVDIEVLEENVYSNIINPSNEWFEIRYKIRLQKNTNIQFVRVGLYVKSDMVLNNGFSYYFDKFKYIGSDKIVIDHRKDNQLIEEVFDKSFVGGIQKLRIYDNALSSQEILHNAKIESRNSAYGLKVISGGRLIDGHQTTSNNPVPVNPVIVESTYIQLKTANNSNVNMVVPVPVIWGSVDHNNIINFLYAGGSKIYFKQSGNFKISYNLIFENMDLGEKIIGTTIRKNGSIMLLPYNTQTYISGSIGFNGSADVSDYEIAIDVNDYVELICFRTGLNGVVSIVANHGWINIEKI